MIAVTPLVAPSPDVQVRPVQLVDAWTTLFTDTTANLDNIASNADASDITQVFSALFTNPLGVLDAITNLDPTVTTTTGTDPLLQVSVELTPALEYILGQLGATGATIEAINGVVSQLQADPSNAFSILYEGTASVLNAYLNGADNVSLLGGIIDIPLYNGVLAPEQTASVDINLTDLVNALGLGNLNVSSLDLSSLLGQLGLGSLNLGQLFDALQLNGSPLSDAGLGTLLADASTPVTTLGGLLNLLGLGSLDAGTFDLTSVLSGLGLDATDLNSLTLDQVLTAFNINPDLSILNEGLGSLLTTGQTDSILAVLTSLGIPSIVSGDLTQALNAVSLGSLLGITNTSDDNLAGLLAALGINNDTGSDVTVGTLLTDLGFPSSTGDLTLSQLLGDLVNTSSLDPLNLNITDALNNTLDLGHLLSALGLSSLPLNLSDLGDLSGLNLDGLLGDLGLGNLADVTVSPLGGLITELVDTVPQQILAAL
jgi:hypothetical protein